MYRISCSEIWGGITDIDQDVCSAGLSASVYSNSCAGGRGGDIYYVSVCQGDMLTRLAIADVVGHGESVTNVSTWMYDALQARMNEVDGNVILADLNHLADDHGLEAMTTAAVVSFFTRDSTTYYAYAGHHPMLIWRRAENQWREAAITGPTAKRANLPLGVLPDTTYDQSQEALQKGDRLFLYTDGVIEAPDHRGELFGELRLKTILRNCSSESVASIKNNVLKELRNHVGGQFRHDDVTMLAVEIH